MHISWGKVEIRWTAHDARLGLLGCMSLGRVVHTLSEGEEHTLWIIPELARSATYH